MPYLWGALLTENAVNRISRLIVYPKTFRSPKAEPCEHENELRYALIQGHRMSIIGTALLIALS